ncbi:aminodeoxychorismate synthase component I [Acetobacter thailandicus]|uniref:aminodeoxychorismate synthase component I n=1 Tax=Acetobacter thailandicus TaxID=1502842 RepID=UPI001BA67873|nr:aminodeoxychorismate synthase component I [Acetobacter thailandicus]MBS0980133.1 aminodeoxychorismate synthase component I [Acetobacter thailandicus]
MVQLWAQLLPWKDPEAVFAAWGERPWCAFLDSGGPEGERSRWQILCIDPEHAFIVPAGDEAGSASVFKRLRHFMPVLVKGCKKPLNLPFYGGFIGFAGYGCGMQQEKIATRHTDDAEPQAAFALYNHAVLWDRQEKRAYVAGFCRDDMSGWQQAGLQARFHTAWAELSSEVPVVPALPRLAFEADRPRSGYCMAVMQARNYIAAGDIFQVNVTGRYSASLPENFSDVALYSTLRRQAPAPFGAYLRCGHNYALHSTSPERFLQVSTQGEVSTRPIKGTAPRGRDAQQDIALAHALSENEKERAENLMIVDLMRNDIGRVAQTGSVHVPDLMQVERFEHVHHLVSEVRAQLNPDQDVFDLLQATLPPGSVTGAPKHRAMQIIDEIEAGARGAYCGAVLQIGVDGRLDSSVIIRTLVRHRNRLHVSAGGGITILSDPETEYEEMRLKLRPLLALFGAEP